MVDENTEIFQLLFQTHGADKTASDTKKVAASAEELARAWAKISKGPAPTRVERQLGQNAAAQIRRAARSEAQGTVGVMKALGATPTEMQAALESAGERAKAGTGRQPITARYWGELGKLVAKELDQVGPSAAAAATKMRDYSQALIEQAKVMERAARETAVRSAVDVRHARELDKLPAEVEKERAQQEAAARKRAIPTFERPDTASRRAWEQRLSNLLDEELVAPATERESLIKESRSATAASARQLSVDRSAQKAADTAQKAAQKAQDAEDRAYDKQRQNAFKAQDAEEEDAEQYFAGLEDLKRKRSLGGQISRTSMRPEVGAATARGLNLVSDAAQGLMLGTSAATGNIVGLGMSLIFLKWSALAVSVPVAALSLAFMKTSEWGANIHKVQLEMEKLSRSTSGIKSGGMSVEMKALSDRLTHMDPLFKAVGTDVNEVASALGLLMRSGELSTAIIDQMEQIQKTLGVLIRTANTGGISLKGAADAITDFIDPTKLGQKSLEEFVETMIQLVGLPNVSKIPGSNMSGGIVQAYRNLAPQFALIAQQGLNASNKMVLFVELLDRLAPSAVVNKNELNKIAGAISNVISGFGLLTPNVSNAVVEGTKFAATYGISTKRLAEILQLQNDAFSKGRTKLIEDEGKALNLTAEETVAFDKALRELYLISLGKGNQVKAEFLATMNAGNVLVNSIMGDLNQVNELFGYVRPSIDMSKAKQDVTDGIAAAQAIITGTPLTTELAISVFDPSTYLIHAQGMLDLQENHLRLWIDPYGGVDIPDAGQRAEEARILREEEDARQQAILQAYEARQQAILLAQGSGGGAPSEVAIDPAYGTKEWSWAHMDEDPYDYAEGGISWHPQLARVSERGPEAHLPLSLLNRIGGGSITVQINAQGAMFLDRDGPRKLADIVAQELIRVMPNRRQSVSLT